MALEEKIIAAPETSGEYIRPEETFVVLGGAAGGYQLVTAVNEKSDRKADSFEDYLIGERLERLGKTSPIGLVVRIQIRETAINAVSRSSTLSAADLEAVVEKKIGDLLNLISGVSHQYTRDRIEIRISADAVKEGITFEKIEAFLREQLTAEFPFIDSASVRIYTDTESVEAGLKTAQKKYRLRDERALLLRDEEVPTFYGCKICQISSPAHVCVITPERPSVCGTISWTEAGAAVLANPDGPIFEIEKGQILDADGGEYAGVNAAIAVESGGENQRILLYALIENPHTTGSVFDIIAFYIPEIGGIGLADRATKTVVVNGLTFEEMTILTGYGQQISGFSGVGETYLLSGKFMQKEGGWENVFWMTQSLKEKMLQRTGAAPERFESLRARLGQIPTEKEAPDLKQLSEFWKRESLNRI